MDSLFPNLFRQLLMIREGCWWLTACSAEVQQAANNPKVRVKAGTRNVYTEQRPDAYSLSTSPPGQRAFWLHCTTRAPWDSPKNTKHWPHPFNYRHKRRLYEQLCGRAVIALDWMKFFSDLWIKHEGRIHKRLCHYKSALTSLAVWSATFVSSSDWDFMAWKLLSWARVGLGDARCKPWVIK